MNPKDRINDTAVETGKAANATDPSETAQALELAIAQIGMALRESDHAVQTLISAMTMIAACVHRIEEKVDTPCQPQNADAVLTECKRANDSMQQAITAFQFYDLLSQRFQHIEANLQAVVEIMHAPERQHPAMWKHLHDKLRSFYSLEQEQAMYQALLRGLSADDMIDQTDAAMPPSRGDIELF